MPLTKITLTDNFHIIGFEVV